MTVSWLPDPHGMVVFCCFIGCIALFIMKVQRRPPLTLILVR